MVPAETSYFTRLHKEKYMKYRNRIDGSLVSKQQLIKGNKRVSLPARWNPSTLDALGVDPVLESPKPECGEYQTAFKSGAVKDSLGNWVTDWDIREMFTEYVNEEGEAVTVDQQKTQYDQIRYDRQAESVRSTRQQMLSETDFYALSDVTMPTEVVSYRQALRDLSGHENFPYLTESDWPVKP
jgi:hypothetical protein